jgi:hypothetical protein
MARIPNDWTVTIIENKTTEIVVACAPPAYGLITPEKYRELQIRKAVANPKSVIVRMTYAQINNRRKKDRTTQELRGENDQSKQGLLNLWVAKV